MNVIKSVSLALLATVSISQVSEARPARQTPASPQIIVPQGTGSVTTYRGRAPRMDGRRARFPKRVGTCSSSNTERVCHFVQDKGNTRTVTVIRTPR